MIEDKTANMLNFTNTTLSMLLNKFAVKFQKVSEESLSRDKTLRQTCQELFFHKHLSHFLYKIELTKASKLSRVFIKSSLTACIFLESLSSAWVASSD